MTPHIHPHRFVLSVLLAIGIFAAAQSPAPDQADLGIVNRIRFEGLGHSQVGKLAAFLSDVIGPRPTGSPELDRANRWAAERMKEWGMTNVALEPYDNFGRAGPSAVRLGPSPEAPLRPPDRHLGRMGLEHQREGEGATGLKSTFNPKPTLRFGGAGSRERSFCIILPSASRHSIGHWGRPATTRRRKLEAAIRNARHGG